MSGDLDGDLGGWVPFVLIGSDGLWAADCLVPGCCWTATTSTPEAADRLALAHHATDHSMEGAIL